MSKLWGSNSIEQGQILFTDDNGNEFNLSEMHEEKELRKQHPGLQEAWEKYQIMLQLCKEQNNDKA